LPVGELVGTDAERGHQLRDESPPSAAGADQQDVGVVIVGAGVAGLSAARRLRRGGFEDFVVLELEPAAGGTSRSGRRDRFAFPWGAHYVPVPLAENRALVELLDEMGVVEGRDEAGELLIAEQFLCREPQERLFYGGAWHEDLNPFVDATDEERCQWEALDREIRRWAGWRDARGRRAFALPVAAGSDDAEVTALDRLTMADWLDQHGWTAPRLRWIVDYACRDDYGLRVEQTSAWAGVFYFVSRRKGAEGESQPLITWPEGNGRIVEHLTRAVHDRLRLNTAVCAVIPRERDGRLTCEVLVRSAADDPPRAFRAQRVIFAAPQFVAPFVIRHYRRERGTVAAEFSYGAWMVANLFLRDRPRETGFPLAWDNVLYDSPGLGYVTATHQAGIDHGPTVWTYYHALCDEQPEAAWERLLSLERDEWAEVALSDLEQAHPDLRPLVTRLDVMRWGHAMIRPRPGFLWGPARFRAQEPFRGIHFAHSDLSGVALLEEALYHGERAAGEVLAALGRRA
jgi:hypothetical protein